MEKKRLRTITLLFSKKIVIRKKRTITTKNEKNETKEKYLWMYKIVDRKHNKISHLRELL